MFKKGRVVLIPFPFTDLSGSKVRPAVILSSGGGSEDVVVAFISSQKNKSRDPFAVPIVPSITNGLKVPSMIKCAKLATLDKKIILGELGNLDDSIAKSLNKKLRELFDI